MDKLTKEKFIYLGKNPINSAVSTVMEKAEEYIHNDSGNYPMVTTKPYNKILCYILSVNINIRMNNFCFTGENCPTTSFKIFAIS